ncbi:MAG TPA: hypothetical protein VHH36_09390, partial [Candidatus Thermoplasmatota archaeon]|nr:hypothetical protein [Candidatus Thermoplasmatota archaeon]
MKTVTFVVALGFAATALVALAPTANAVGTCTELRNASQSPDCPYLFCYGTSWSYPDPYVRCHECFDPWESECDWPVRL